MQPIGEVRTCAHCKGEGVCGGNGVDCCLKCARYSGHDIRVRIKVVCSTCGGKGSVWIGPDTVYINTPSQ